MTVERSTDTQRIAKALDSLPTLPVVALQIGDIVQSRTATVQAVVEVLRGDPSMSAKLLRLVNSPYFGIPGGVPDIARAVPFVGFNALYELVVSVSVIGTLGSTSSPFDLRPLWLHSLTTATAARELAAQLRFADPGACFTGGLLHDMGRIALAKVEPGAVAMAVDAARAGTPIDEAERLHGLPPHDAIGVRLARQWRFPAMLAAPIEHHHAPHRVTERNQRAVTEIVALADHVAGLVAAEPTWEDGTREPGELFARTGLDPTELPALVEKTREQLERSKVFLSLAA